MQTFAARVLHDTLANSLGRILDISREQLRVSLWSAWRAGLTLEDVALRCDAFEHLQLPFTLRSGRIGRIQAQVPWATLRSLRSPVIVELADVHLCVVLRRDEELEEGPAGERAWLAKQAELAAAELAALAAASAAGGADADAAAAAAGRQGGVLASFMQHVVAMLVNRLQLTVSGVHIQFEDPQSGTCVGVQLRRLHTCLPGEAEHASLLLSEDAGVMAHGSAVARGSIQKQFAVEGLALYWQPGASPAPDPAGSCQHQQEASAGGQPASPDGGAAAAGIPATALQLAPQQQQQQLAYVLLPTDCVIHSTLALSAADGGMRAHAAAVTHHLPLSLDGRQAADMLVLADRLAWCAARNRFAAYCPTGWRQPGARTVPWRRVWQYAVNAVLHELRGGRQGAVAWRDGAERAALRRQYVAAYRAFLERKHLEGAPASLAREEAADEQLQQLERALSVDDVLTCRHVAQRVLDALLAAASGMGAAMEDAAAAASRSRRRVQPLPASVVGGPTLGGATAAAAAPPAGPSSRAASLGGSSSAASSVPLASAGSAGSSGGGRRRGYLAWGLSKAAGFLRYLPYSAAGEGRGGSAVALPEPTEAELEELYQAVDFHPEEQQAAAAASGRAGGGAAGLHLSLDCLVSSTSLLLLDGAAGTPASHAASESSQEQQQQDQGQQQQPNEQAHGGQASELGRGPGGSAIATLELERLRLGAQLRPDQATASLSLAGLAAHDLCSEGPGISSRLLSRGSTAANCTTSPPGSSHPPLLRLSFSGASPSAAAGEAGQPLPQERRPQLDILVQPLLLLLRPRCVQRLAALVPPALPASFHGLQLAALNALGAEARCAIKACEVARMGPPLDLLVKVLDVEVWVGGGEYCASPGVSLRTGPITLHSIDAQQQAAQRQQQQAGQGASPARPPHRSLQRQLTPNHALTAAEAAAHLSAVIKQRRVAARLGGAAAAVVGTSPGAGPSGSSLDAAAAVAAVEQRLLYQQFEVIVADLQAAAVTLPSRSSGGSGSGGGSGSDGGGRRSASPGLPGGPSGGADGGGFGRQWQPVLQPLRLAGLLKIHRIAEDYGLPQVQCALQVDPISLSLTHTVVQLLVDALTLPAAAQQPLAQTQAAPAAAAPPLPSAPLDAQPASASTTPGSASAPGGTDASPTGGSPLDGIAPSAGGPAVPVLALDLQLAFLDLRCVADGLGPGSGGAGPAGAAVAALEARVACAGASLSVHSMLDGLAVKLSASRLLLHDLSPNTPQPQLPPPVRGTPVPRVARLLAIDRLSVSHTASFSGGGGGVRSGGPHSETRIELQDLTVEGYAGEAGSFLSRLHERQATQVRVTVHDGPAATRTAVSASNLLIGHGLLLRLAALGEALVQEQQQQQLVASEVLAAGSGAASDGAGSPAQQQQQQQQQQEQVASAARQEDGLQAPPAAVPSEAAAAAAAAAAARAGPPLLPEPSSLEQWATALEDFQLGASSSQGSIHADEQQLAAAAIAQAEASQLVSPPAGAEQRQGAAAMSTRPSQSPPQAPAKQLLTSIQLTDCRLVLRYQPALHPGGGAGGSGHRGGGAAGLGGAGIPPATHDFLSVHHDLLAVDVPLLHLQMPLDPAGLAAAAVAEEEWAPTGPPSFGALSQAGDSDESAAAASTSSGDASPQTVAGSSVSWGDVPWAAAAAATGGAEPACQKRRRRPQQKEQVLLEAGKLTVSVAAVGYARHAMLPLLQVPSLRVACTAGGGAAPQAGGSSSSSAGRRWRASSSQQRLRHSSSGSSPVTPSSGRPPSQAAHSTPAAVALLYRVDVAAIDVGLHPSQLSMLTSAVQLCQHELAVLGREAADGSAGDTESVITSTSGTEQQQQPAPPQRLAHMPSLPRRAPAAAGGGLTGATPAAAAAAAEAAASGQQEAGIGPAAEAQRAAAAGGGSHQAAAPSPQWRLEAAVGCVGFSLLGATPSSSCLKLEWQGLWAACSAGGSLANGGGPSSPPAGSSTGQQESPGWPGGSPGGGSGSPGSGAASEGARQEQALDAQLGWRQLAVHVLHPRLSYTHPGLTPFAFASTVVGDAFRRDSSQRGGLGAGSPQAASPRVFMPLAAAPGAEVFYQRGRGPLSSIGAPLGGVRRNLSSGLGLAESVDEFHDATAQLARTSYGSSRYLSLAESEFEDAASELEPGSQSPTLGHSPLSLPLPLVLGSEDYSCRLLLLLHGQTAPTDAAADAASLTASVSSTAAGVAGEGAANGLGSSSKRLSGSGGAAIGTVVAVQLAERLGQAVVEIDSMALRVHAAGWEDAAQCLHTYAVLAQEAQRQYTASAEARAASPLGHRRLLPAPTSGAAKQSPTEQEEQVQRQGLALRLHLRALLVELLADAEQQEAAPQGGAGSGSGSLGSGQGLLPACTLQAQLRVEASQGAEGSSQLKLLVPGLLLAVGVVPDSVAAGDGGGGSSGLPPALALPLQDSLLGLHRLELSLVSQQQQRQLQPAATTADGSVLLGPAHQVSVGASLAHASLWAHPRNLCAAAALAGHARALAEGLAGSLGGGEFEVAGDRGGSAAGPAGSAGALPRQLTLKLNVQKAALLLSLLSREDVAEAGPAGQHRLLAEPAPLLELAAAAITADVHDMGQGSLEGTVKSEVQVAAFSAVKAGWEPLVEPWHCRLQFAAPTSSPPPPTQHQRLTLSSTHGLEVTVTQAALEAAVMAGGVVQAAAAVAADPSALGERLEAACGSAAHSAAFWLHNETGSALELWLAADDGDGSSLGGACPGGSTSSSFDSGSAGDSTAAAAGGSRRASRVPSGLPELVVRPGARAVLPVVAAGGSGAAQHQGVHVGAPCPVQGVARPRASFCADLHHSSSRLGLAGLGAAPGTPRRAPSFGALGGGGMAPRQSRPLLYFRLAEQQEVCGPLHLDRGCFSGCEGCATACPGVLCDMVAARHGGYTLTLHSGVLLRNTTLLALDIGVQTPMGLVMEPQALGTLRPGGAMWLPALRAHTGLLCLRPAVGPGTAAQPPQAQQQPPPQRPPLPAAAALQTAATWQPGDTTVALGSRIPALASDSLAAAAALVAGNQPVAAGAAAPPPAGLLPAQRLPSSPLLYSTAGLASPARHSSEHVDAGRQGPQSAGQRAPPVAAPWHPYEWSAAVPLQSLLRQAAGAEGGAGGGGGRGGGTLEGRSRAARQLACMSTAEHQPPVLLCMGATRLSGSTGSSTTATAANGSAAAAALASAGFGSWEVLLSAPLTLHNALPVPLDVSLSAWGQGHRLHLQPNQHAALHAVDAAHVESLTLRALGYHPSSPITPAPLSAMAAGGGDAGSGGGAFGLSGAGPGGTGGRELLAPDTEVLLQEVGHSKSEVQVFVRHSLDTATGSHKLLLGCTLWVFNCTGVPVSLRQSGADGALLFGERSDATYQRLVEDEVPESWLPPLELPGQGPGQGGAGTKSASQSPLQQRTLPTAGLRAVSREGIQSALSTPTSTAPSVINASRGASATDIAGLSEILEGGGSAGAGTASRSGDSRQVLGLKRTVSRARGIADSMEATPAFETPSRWPSIQGGLQPHRHRLRLQIRATQCQAPAGRTYWSDPVELDGLGGAAVVTVPSPLLPPTASIPAARAAYMMSVTASQVPGSQGALALYLLPRYLLINTLDVPIQYKQQGTLHERELGAGASRSLRWSDALRPLRLCVRVQEAGWLWSGGFELDSPGDMFIKIRHRDRGVTMLVRVDLAASAASGVLRVTLSHHPAGFAPYRIENCSLETLHARQHKVREQQDVLRPYCSLTYAWDEPSLPHRLVLELPGARTLGTFDLDKVGQDVVLAVPTKRGEPQRRVRVLVRTEGPTRVLTVLDTQRHSLLEEMTAAGAAGGAEGEGGSARRPSWPPRGPWDAWSLPTLGGAQQQGKKGAKVSGLLWEVCAELASLGVSLVAPSREMAYLQAGGLRATMAGTAAHLVLDLELRRLQLDNPSPWVALPVTLQIPAPISRLTSTVAAAVDVQRRPALVARLALWQRRPAGVLCIEQADLQLAPVAVYVEQQHALQLAEFVAGTVAGLEAAAAAAASAAARGAGAGAGHRSGSGGSGGGGGDEGGVAGPDAPPAFLLPASAGLGAVASAAARLPQLSPELEALLSGRGAALLAPAEQKVYIDVLRIATLELSITFLPAPFQPDPGHPRLLALQRMLSLADVEDARLRLAALELRNPLMGTSALAQLLQRHYTRALLPELYKVVGSASVFGDPVRLFHHLGLGVWSFLASPAAGLVESARQRGPRQFIAGVGSGVRGLFQNVVFALSNAATKGSTAARKAITALGLDRLHPQDAWAGGPSRRRLRWEQQAGVGGGGAGAGALSAAGEAGPAAGSVAGDGGGVAVIFSPRDGDFDGPQPGGAGGVLGAVLLGVVGLAAEPIRGLDEDGLVGLLSGITRGAIGVVVLPLASLLEMLASTADSIRRAVAGSSNVGWVRPPRYVHATQPLEPYSWAEAMGRWLLTELERASLARQAQRAAAAGARGGGGALRLQQAAPPARHGAFVLCTPLAERSCFVVLTTKCVLYICAREPMWVPAVRWSSTVADLELVGARGAHLSLVAQQPLRRHIVRSANVLPRALADVLKAPRPPFSFLSVECETAAGAQQLQAALLQLQARMPPLAAYIGHCQVLTPPPSDWPAD